MNWKKALSVLLALATCATIALALDVNGELKNALLEKRAADPSGTGNVTARVYYNTTSNVMKMFNGTSWLQIADTSTAIVNPMDSAGDLIVGDVGGAATKLDSGTANYVLQANGAASPTWVNTLYMGDGTVSLPPYSNNGDADTGMWFPSANLVGIAVGGQDTFRVSTGDVSVSVASNSSVAGARVDLLRAEGTSLASPSVILADDEIAQIAGSGYSGAAGGYLSAADIVMLVDGTPDSGGDTTDMPGRIEFRTSPDGTSVPVTALTIKGSGQLQAVNGSNTVPSYGFTGTSANTGMYLNGTDIIGWSVDGVIRAQMTTTALEASARTDASCGIGNICSGTYTPTASTTVNLDATPAPSSWYFMRVGNVVTAAGRVTSVNPTSIGTDASFDLTVSMISGTFAGTQSAAGTCVATASGASTADPWAVSAVAATNRIRMFANPSVSTGHSIHCTVTYLYQ